MSRSFECPRLEELPPPPAGRSGWPWTEATPARDEDLEFPQRGTNGISCPQRGTNGISCPLISIVIPSYNQAAFVEETLRAILLQGYPKLELLYCEDASTDDTLEVIAPYAEWMTLLPAPENLGMSNAINRGYRVAAGEIVTWIATDDVYRPGAFWQVADRWRANPRCGALVGAVRFIDHDSKPVGDKIPARLERPAPLDLSIEPLENWRLHQASTFYTAEGLEVAGRYVREELLYVMDRDLIFRVAARRPVEILEETLARFRLHRASKSWSTGKVIDFAREFGQLQEAFIDGNAAEDRIRRRIKNHRMVKGYLRYGARGDRAGRRLACLVKAAALRPGLLLRKSYYHRWLAALKLEEPLRRLLGRGDRVSLTRGI